MKASLIAALSVFLLSTFAALSAGQELVLETRIRGEVGSLDDTLPPRWLAAPTGGQLKWFTILFQPDGKLLGIGYEYVDQENLLRGHLFRVNVDGTLDTTFAPQLECATNSLVGCPYAFYVGQLPGAYFPLNNSGSVWLQPDERILISQDPEQFKLVRLLPEGALDGSFAPN